LFQQSISVIFYGFNLFGNDPLYENRIPGTEINTIERCSGHAGTYGVKKGSHDVAMKIGKPVFNRMAEEEPNYISSDCQLAGHHIEQGMEELGLPKSEMAHPLTLLAKAYGL
jgi:Fe-S oxidoreductase